MALDIALRTDRGLNEGRKENEDACGFAVLPTKDNREITVAVVADGMGGRGQGTAAANTAVDWLLRKRTLPQFSDKATFAKWLHDEVRAAHEQVQGTVTTERAGTTCTAVAVHRGVMSIAHVGNGRVYLYSDKRLTQLTIDHTLDAALQATGIDTAGTEPRHAALLRSLGGQRDLSENYVDTLYESGELGATLTSPLYGGEVLVVCTDGLWSVVNEQEIARVVASETSADVIAERLIALARGHGAPDNASLIVVRDPSEAPTKARTWSSPVPPPVQAAPPSTSVPPNRATLASKTTPSPKATSHPKASPPPTIAKRAAPEPPSTTSSASTGRSSPLPSRSTFSKLAFPALTGVVAAVAVYAMLTAAGM